MQVNDRLTILKGPYVGLVGEVLKVEGKRVLVSLKGVQNGQPVDVEKWFLWAAVEVAQ